MYRCTLVHSPSVSSSKCIKTNKNSCLLYEIFKISQRGIQKAHQCIQMKIIFAFQFLWGGTNFVRPSALCIRVLTVSYEFLQMQSIYMGHFVKSFSNIFFHLPRQRQYLLVTFLIFQTIWPFLMVSSENVRQVRVVDRSFCNDKQKRCLQQETYGPCLQWPVSMLKTFSSTFLVIYNVIYSYRKKSNILSVLRDTLFVWKFCIFGFKSFFPLFMLEIIASITF